jgi:hypothetical protein
LAISVTTTGGCTSLSIETCCATHFIKLKWVAGQHDQFDFVAGHLQLHLVAGNFQYYVAGHFEFEVARHFQFEVVEHFQFEVVGHFEFEVFERKLYIFNLR